MRMLIFISLLVMQCYGTEGLQPNFTPEIQPLIKNCLICFEDEKKGQSEQEWVRCPLCTIPFHCFCLKKWQLNHKKLSNNAQFSCPHCQGGSTDLVTFLDGVSLKNRALNKLLAQASLLLRFSGFKEKAIEPFVLWWNKYHCS